MLRTEGEKRLKNPNPAPLVTEGWTRMHKAGPGGWYCDEISCLHTESYWSSCTVSFRLPTLWLRKLKKKKNRSVTAIDVESIIQWHFLLSLRKKYSCPTALASTLTCTGTASNDPTLTLAGAQQILPASHNIYSVLLSCFHAAPQEEAGSAVRGRGTGGALQGQQVSLKIPHNPSLGIPNPVRGNLVSIFHSVQVPIYYRKHFLSKFLIISMYFG